MKKRLKKLILIVAIIVSTAAYVTQIGATEATYFSISQIKDLPEDERLYGSGQEVPIAAINEIEAEVEITAETNKSYPAKYDPREEGKVTGIKDQGNTGLCWDYATIGTAESCLIQQGYATNAIDLSELHLAYFSYKDSKSTQSFAGYCNAGLGEASIYFQRNVGPVPESVVPMTTITNDLVIDESLHYRHLDQAFVQRVKGSFSDTDTIKEMILTYGGVYASFYWYQNGQYFKETGNDTSYHFPYNIKSANHAVEIVGWDDNFSGKDFTNETENGAWLVKNSWGAHGYHGSGSGFYWVPYSEYSLSIGSGFSYRFGKAEEAVSKVELSEHQLTMYVGQSKTISTKVLPETAIDKSITYLAVNDNKSGAIEVSQDGNIKAVRAGQCSLKVRSNNFTDIVDICQITVLEDEITIEAPQQIYGIGKEGKIQARSHASSTFTFQSSNESILKVDAEGKIVTCGYGDCDITVSSKSAPSKNVRIRVLPGSFCVSETKITGKEGEKKDISLFLDGQRLGSQNLQLCQNLADISYVGISGDEIAEGYFNPAEDEAYITLKKAGNTTLHITYDGYGAGLSADIAISVEAGKPAKEEIEPPEAEQPVVENLQESEQKPVIIEDTYHESQEEEEYTWDEPAIILYQKLCYEKLSDTTVCFIGPNKEQAKVVIPPSIHYNGREYKVVKIADRAFYKHTKLRQVTIPESCTTIGVKAFYGCKKLKSITIKSKKLKTVGRQAFTKIDKKAVINVPKGKSKKYKKLIGNKQIKIR